MGDHAHGYAVLPFTRTRRATLDLALVTRQRAIHALFHADVTCARALLAAYEARTGESLSFTAFIIACVARAVEEHKEVQAYRQGKRHLIVFDDVDVTTLVERHTPHGPQLAFHIVRAAQHKTVREIHREIRASQTGAGDIAGGLRGQRIFTAIPRLLRRPLIRLAGRSPRLWKPFGGTVAVTSVGMFARGVEGWGVPTMCNTLDVTVGGIAPKVCLIDGRVVEREYLSLTVSVDHDIVDGAPAARYATRLKALVEQAYGLDVLGVDVPDAEPSVAAQAPSRVPVAVELPA